VCRQIEAGGVVKLILLHQQELLEAQETNLNHENSSISILVTEQRVLEYF